MTRPRWLSGNISGTKGRENYETGLADSHQGVANEQAGEIVGEGGEQGGAAPDESPGDDDGLTREALRQRAHEGSGAHVKDEEYAGEQAKSGIAAMKLRLH